MPLVEKPSATLPKLDRDADYFWDFVLFSVRILPQICEIPIDGPNLLGSAKDLYFAYQSTGSYPILKFLPPSLA